MAGKNLTTLKEFIPGEKVSNDEWLEVIKSAEENLQMDLAELKKLPDFEIWLGRIRIWLENILQQGVLSPNDRVAAGDLLGKLGDPRFDESCWFLPAEPLLGFVQIPSGEFWMGSKDDGYLASNSTYYMARYPVTVAQFKSFIDSTKFIPGNPDCINGIDNHPVNWVSWYEALSYCEWIGDRLHEFAEKRRPDINLSLLEKEFWDGIKNNRLKVALPSEPEWEKAARGTDGRTYPWGEGIDPEKANYKETGLERTSAVGCFPQGNSPYGIVDMSGNVWNWMRSLMGKDLENFEFNYPYNLKDGREDAKASAEVLRGMRGGGFPVEPRRATCIFRDGVPPNGRDDADGFRLVVTPV